MVLIRLENKNDTYPFVWQSFVFAICLLCPYLTNVSYASESENYIHKNFNFTLEEWPDLNFTTEKTYRRISDDGLFMDRVSLQIVVSVLGTAGVFVLCCVCCAHLCTPVRNYRMREIERYMASYALVQQENQLASASRHRPWNPQVFGFPSEPFSDYNECNDKPPRYDDLEDCPGLQDPCTPPPPYSPSLTKTSHDFKINPTKPTDSK